ncbi:hypothetical protein D0T84_20840 [Dysgonomonas sp. 521]|uniref:SMI1/KNR4 family protein n=1 Tax=Dysgonomonas sp. 521 TaxID=2302932 RepID=UPI0013D39DCF|nr:SMI1/KNR4 family protein [Dysgonomonas sp. 521]NDV97326.1 hypothetical protein [Dysgonomonas sp. 521]
MKIDKELFVKALENFDFDYKSEVQKVTDKSIEFFENLKLPTELIEFLREFSFRGEIDFKGNSFHCVNRIRTENRNEINKEIYKSNLLIIGSGMNGDPIVLNTKTMTVGYVFHDQLWESETVEKLESMYIDLNLSIGDFFYKSVEDEDFPIDAYSAEEYLEKSR